MSPNSGLSRGILRLPFLNRSPSFLMAALLVGLGVLGFSYYSLYNQYSALEIQLKVMNENEQTSRKLFSNKMKSLQIIQTNNEKLEQDLVAKEKELKSKEKKVNQISSELVQAKLVYQVEVNKLKEEAKFLKDKNKELKAALDEANNSIQNLIKKNGRLNGNEKSQLINDLESDKKVENTGQFTGLLLPPFPIVKKLSPNPSNMFNNIENSLKRPDKVFDF